MKYIQNYELLSEETSTSSSVYWKARKDGSIYFLKRFNNPVRPSDRLSENTKKLKNDQCNAFIKERKRIFNAIKSFTGGNLVAPVDFFEFNDGHGTRFFQATLWREIKVKTIKEISELNSAQKLQILKTAAQSVKLINERGIIHLDIKPDNLPVAETMAKRLSCSLIDFDSSYFEDALPEPDLVSVTDPYMSPELAAYKMKKADFANKVTVKNDVFALAIVFHMYWTGRNFIYEGSESKECDPYLYNAVYCGKKVSVSPGVPKWLEDLLFAMIKKNPDQRPTMAQVLDSLKKVNSTSDSKEEIKTVEPLLDEESITVEQKKKEYDNSINYFEIAREKMGKSPITHNEISYKKGSCFPEDAELFEILSNGNVKITYKDNTHISFKLSIAIKKGYISCGE